MNKSRYFTDENEINMLRLISFFLFSSLKDMYALNCFMGVIKRIQSK